MAEFPLLLLLIPYAIIVVIFAVFALLNIIHLIRYSATTLNSFIFTAIFLVGTAAVLGTTWWLLKDVEWSRKISFDFMAAVFPGASGVEL